MTSFGTPFYLTLEAALLAGGWERDRRAGDLWHPASGCRVKHLSGRTVRLARDGEPGQRLRTSRLDDPVAAALDVVRQITAHVRGLADPRRLTCDELAQDLRAAIGRGR